MKKSYFILLLALLASCMKSEPATVITSEQPPALTPDEYRALVALKPNHTIKYDDARQQALEAASLFNNPLTKSASKSISDGLAITNNIMGLTKSDAVEVDTLMYLFNYANDEGYVFVSADERAPGVLAYIEKGYFNIQDSIECPGAAMLFSGMEVLVRQEIQRAEFLKDSLGAIAQAKYETITQSDALSKGPGGETGDRGKVVSITQESRYAKQSPDYGTIVQTNWSQVDPFNGSLPMLPNGKRAFVGCVAVAIAQIMAHYNYPQSYNGVPIYTSELRQYKNGDNFTTPSLKYDIARFNKFIFDNVINEYNESGSGSNYEKARWFLRAMGYSTPWSLVHYNFDDVKASIDMKCLVYTRGNSHRTNNLFGLIYTYSGGHTWIIDHYTNITKTIYEVTQYGSGIVEKKALSSSTKMYNHCNMGNGESHNGYYIDGTFNSSVAPEVKTKSNIDYNYQYNVEIAPRMSIAQ